MSRLVAYLLSSSSSGAAATPSCKTPVPADTPAASPEFARVSCPSMRACSSCVLSSPACGLCLCVLAVYPPSDDAMLC